MAPPFSYLPNNNNMDEVWKNINTTTIDTNINNININNIIHNNSIIHHPTPNTNFRGIIPQHFLNPSIATVDHHHHNQGSVLVTDGGGGCGAVVKKRRSSESTSKNVNVDPKQKRMIKNRESASRSRARKQAYNNELELEVDRLKAENQRLRKQQFELLGAPPTQPPKNRSLIRTLTAPL
ncbi:uncharacterized protein LOC141645828 isoform X2 [Silene latifolia]|uniref:uncharacterized protein LOC141645828 isoform X2 n=1 Tax=Silene latifolia TaxID=37657 RepID=UPI003D780748